MTATVTSTQTPSGDICIFINGLPHLAFPADGLLLHSWVIGSRNPPKYAILLTTPKGELDPEYVDEATWAAVLREIATRRGYIAS